MARAVHERLRAGGVRALSAWRCGYNVVEHDLLQRTSSMMSKAFRLSVAIPLYNEEAGIPELLRRLGIVLDSIPGGPHEMVFVDDGSRDRTLEMLHKAARSDPARGRRVVAQLRPPGRAQCGARLRLRRRR